MGKNVCVQVAMTSFFTRGQALAYTGHSLWGEGVNNDIHVC